MSAEAAMEYLRRGWSVIPVASWNKDPSEAKRPLVAWAQYQTRHATPSEVKDWWAKWPKAGVAIVTGAISGLAVVDFDGAKGLAASKDWPETYTVQTPRGQHRYYTVAANESVRTEAGQTYGEGVDVRGDGGYVIAAPTVRADGSGYRVLADAVPAWRPDRLVTPRTETTTITIEDAPEQDWVGNLLRNGAPAGKRNDSLTRLAGYFAGKEIPEDVAMVLLAEFAGRCRPPIGGDELGETVASAYRTATRRQEPSTPAQAEAREKPVRLLKWSAFLAKHGGTEVAWLVDGWLPEAAIGFVVSPPECYKSWLVGDLALSVVAGVPFLGQFETKRTGPVLVLQQEDHHGATANRFACQIFGKIPPRETAEDGAVVAPDPLENLYVQEDREMRFDSKEALTALESLIEEIRPVLVILDPLYSMVSTDDNMVRAAQQLRILKLWRDKYKCSFILVHHAGKSQTLNLDRERAWGSQFLNAFVEFGYQIGKLQEQPPRTVTKRHFKVAPSGRAVSIDWAISTRADDMHYGPIVKELTSDELDTLLADYNAKKQGKWGGGKAGAPETCEVIEAPKQAEAPEPEVFLDPRECALAELAREPMSAKALAKVANCTENDMLSALHQLDLECRVLRIRGKWHLNCL
jgi:hypothetical protein